jgi:hypothetical protein
MGIKILARVLANARLNKTINNVNVDRLRHASPKHLCFITLAELASRSLASGQYLGPFAVAAFLQVKYEF